MDVILKFVCDHSHVIIESVLTIIVLFVTIFKKKVKINDVFQAILMVIPGLICQAEKLYTVGSEKFSYVFNECLKLLVELTHRKKDDLLTEYAGPLNEAIESILTTPQKKER